MKHKHYDMIMAKAANVELVVFEVDPEGKNKVWSECYVEHGQFPPFFTGNCYFLCLPQHKEACLQWLNGEYESLECSSPFTGGFQQCHKLGAWTATGGYMRDDCEYRIKPKKEKRWIIHSNGVLLATRMFTSKESALHWIDEFNRADEGVLVNEIEVEV